MEEFEIEEGNKLITKFKYNGFVSTKVTDWIEGFPYHKDWNLLMPVVEKIETIETEQDGHFGVFISSNTCMIQGTKLYLALKKAPNTYGFVYMSDPNAIFPTKLESTWYNVVEFIKWYNTQKK